MAFTTKTLLDVMGIFDSKLSAEYNDIELINISKCIDRDSDFWWQPYQYTEKEHTYTKYFMCLNTGDCSGNSMSCAEILFHDSVLLTVSFRMDYYAVLYKENAFWYKKDLPHLSTVPMNEFKSICTSECISLNGWDSETIFQYSLIEPLANEIYELLDVMQRMIKGEILQDLYRAAFKPSTVY